MTKIFDPLLPNAAAIDKGDLRSALDERLIPTFETAAGVQTWTAGTGGTQAVFVTGVGLFSRDDTDTTSAHDGVSVVVSTDSVRFKKDVLLDTIRIRDADLTAPPASPAVGDAYLILGAPTGAWAGEQESIAVLTSVGWEFIPPRVGMLVYVEDVDSWYRYKLSGDWELGLGLTSVSAGSIGFRSLQFPAGLFVIAQQSAPPGSPTSGDVYIVTANPTGAWVGQVGNLAIWNGSAWEFATPVNGWSVWDQNSQALFFFDGSTWNSALDAVYLKRATLVTTGGAGVTPMGLTGTEIGTKDFAVRANTNKVVVRATVHVSGTGTYQAGIFFDAEATARLTSQPSVADNGIIHIMGEISPGDTDSHTYKIRTDGTFLRLDLELIEARPGV